MSDVLNKLQPDRTMYLRGFDHLGAGAAMHNARPDGFEVTGVFRDPSDFAVLVVWDADDFFNHPTLKYLPDTNFAGLTLQFDATYQNLMPLNCTKYATIDWPYLDMQFNDGTSKQVRLSEYAQTIANPDPPASGAFEIAGPELQVGDRLTLWHLNMSFDYIVPDSAHAKFCFFIDAGAPHATYTVSVGGISFGYTLQDNDTAAMLVQNLVAAINAGSESTGVAASAGEDAGTLVLTLIRDSGNGVTVSGTGNAATTLHIIQASTVASELARQINSVDYDGVKAPFPLAATADGTTLTITTTRGGYDANFVRLLAVNKTDSLSASPTQLQLSGGASTATLRVNYDFSANLGVELAGQIRKMWLTFAPRLADAQDFVSQEWHAAFDNWMVTGPDAVRQLQVPGPCSYWIGATDGACQYAGQWSLVDGFYLGGLGKIGQTGAQVTVKYTSAFQHDVWLATELNATGGEVHAVLDAGAATASTLTVGAGDAVTVRRLLFSRLPPGFHTVTLTVESGTVLFDHLIVSVPTTDTPALPAQTDLSAALDYSTDHSYKLPPARILWLFKKLGLAGPINQYIGVFWWNQRKSVGDQTSTAEVRFSGGFVDEDQIFLNIGGQVCGKTVRPADTPESISQHFANFINAIYVGVWAEANGAVLRIHTRSSDPAYRYTLQASFTNGAGSTGSATVSGSLQDAQPGTWQIDPAQNPPLNAGARAWHSDFYKCAAAAGLEVTTSCSMELVNPPDGYAALFADGTAVTTDVDFADLHSTHCAFSSPMQAYHTRVYTWLAQAMAAAGLSPVLQCGEFTWWYLAHPAPYAEFAFYAAGNGHSHFITVNGVTYSHVENNPQGESSADVANALVAAVNAGPDPHVGASIGSALYIVRLTPSAISSTPIALSSDNGSTSLLYAGGMAYYDEETATAAQTALRRPLAAFLTPNDDPTINASADATFLRNRLRDYCGSITSAVKAAIPGTQFEILFPDDVNYPQPEGMHGLGGRLNRFVNLPPEWNHPGGSGFDRFKLEDLDFGAWSKDLNLVRQCQQLPATLGWPTGQVSCITPVFRPGYAWMKEVSTAREQPYHAVTLWAFDHVNLFGLDLAAARGRMSLFVG